MSDPAIIAALRVKRAELEGDLSRAEQRAAALRDDVLTIDGALRIFDPTAAPQAPRKPQGHSGAVHFSRAILDTLRRADAPMSCRQIAMRIAAERGMDVSTTGAMTMLINRIRSVLARKRGGLASEKRGEAIFWRVE